MAQNQPSPDGRDAIRDALDRQDEHDLEAVYEQTAQRVSAGVYDLAATMLDLKSGDIHVDLGSGYPYLLARLRQKAPNSILIGVERSMPMACLAHRLIVEQGGRACLYACDGMFALDNDTVQRQFLYNETVPELAKLKRFEPGGPIGIIQDDLRRMDVLKPLLAGRRPHSLSFLFPGAFTSFAYEAPFGFRDVKHSDIPERLQHVITTTRMAAYRFASETLAPGGKLLLGERAAPLGERSLTIEDLKLSTQRALQSWSKYWVEGAAFINTRPHDISNGLPSAIFSTDTSAQTALLPRDAQAYHFLNMLVRNDVPFREN